jgi:hypothetical protein
MLQDSDLQDPARLGRKWKKWAIRGPSLRAERWQDHAKDFVIVMKDGQESLIKEAFTVAICRTLEFIFETERVQKSPEAGIVVASEAFMSAEWIRNAR